MAAVARFVKSKSKPQRNFADDSLDDFQHLRKYGCKKFCMERESWYAPQCTQYLKELLAGVTVAFALVPECVSWALIAHLPASNGLLAAFWVGLVTSSLGGRPTMISAASGSMSVVMPDYVDKYCIFPNPVNDECPVVDRGAQFIFLSVIFAGIFQCLCGLIRLPDVLLRLLPHTAVVGFANALAIIIARAELVFFVEDREYVTGLKAGLMTLEVLLSIVIQIFWPRLVTKRVPGPLISLVVITSLHWAAGFDTPTVESYSRQGGGQGIQGEFRTPHWPYICEESEYNITDNATGEPMQCQSFSGYNLEIVGDAMITGIILCFVGLVEALLTLLLVSDRTETPGDSNRECFGQGLGNVTAGMFVTMGGCAMIGQTWVNLQAGGRLRVAGVVAAFMLLLTVLLVPIVLGALPLGALVGVVIMISIDTFEWRTFQWLFILPWMDSVVILTVTVLAAIFNLAVGVGVGIVLQALVFSWSASSRSKMSSRTILSREVIGTSSREAKEGTDSEDPDAKPPTVVKKTTVDVARYVMTGPLFFGSSDLFQAAFMHMREDPAEIIVHLDNVRIYDSSGLEALQNVAYKAGQLDKKLTFVISAHAKRFIDRSADFLTGFDYVVTEENPYYMCPKNDKCRRSCRKERLDMCSCFHRFTGAFSTMWARLDACQRKCCYACCLRSCANNKKCLDDATKVYGPKGDQVQYKAHIVYEQDHMAMAKLNVGFAFPVAPHHDEFAVDSDEELLVRGDEAVIRDKME